MNICWGKDIVTSVVSLIFIYRQNSETISYTAVSCCHLQRHYRPLFQGLSWKTCQPPLCRPSIHLTNLFLSQTGTVWTFHRNISCLAFHSLPAASWSHFTPAVAKCNEGRTMGVRRKKWRPFLGHDYWPCALPCIVGLLLAPPDLAMGKG